jgi:phosphoglycolate phosphatase
MGVRGVLFDKDGTLISFEKTWGPAIGAVIDALARSDEAKRAAQARALHFSLEEQRFLPTSPIIAGSTGHYGPLWAAALGRSDHSELKAEIDALSAVESLKSLTPIGEPRRIVMELKSLGLAIGVATNDSQASARRQIAALGLADLVNFVVGYDSGHGAKPEPGMILAFAGALGCSPGEVAMVGDTLHDLDAARAAGAIAVAVLSGPAAREALEPRADHVLDDIGGLPELMARLAW